MLDVQVRRNEKNEAVEHDCRYLFFSHICNELYSIMSYTYDSTGVMSGDLSSKDTGAHV